MKRYFEFVGGKSAKSWQIAPRGNEQSWPEAPAALLSIVLCLALIGVAQVNLLAEEQPATKPSEVPPALLTTFGTVLDPAGKPLAGAKVYLRVWSTRGSFPDPVDGKSTDILATTQSDAQGAFRFDKVPAKPMSEQWLREIPWDVVVVAKPYAMAWRHLDAAQQSRPLQIKLTPEATVAGRVTDQQGKPIQNATVTLGAIEPLGSDWPCWAYADPGELILLGSRLVPAQETDADGRVTFAGLPRDARLYFRVRHVDFHADVAFAATTNEPQPDIAVSDSVDGKRTTRAAKVLPSAFSAALAPALPRLVGRVLAADTKKPLAKALVAGYLGGPTISTRTRSDGQFSLLETQQSRCRLFVYGPPGTDYLGRVLFVDVPRDKKETQIDVELNLGQIVSGVVVDKETGKGVAGVGVAFDMGLDLSTTTIAGPLPTSDTTDGNGRFRLAVPPGKGKIRISGDVRGYDLPRLRVRMEDIEGFFEEIEVIADKPTPEVKFSVARKTPEAEKPLVREESSPVNSGLTRARRTIYTTVEGTVTDPEGKPVAGAEVKPYSDRPVVTDGNGRFSFRTEARTDPPRPVSEPKVILATHKERKLWGYALQPAATRADAATTPVDIRLRPTGVVTGRVLEGDKPIVGAPVALTLFVPEEGGRPGRLMPISMDQTKTDENGRFEFPLAAADQQLDVSARVEGHIDPGPHPANVSAGQTREIEPLSLLRTDRSVAGIVVDPDGNPVAGAWVDARLRSGGQARTMRRPTGEDGRFTIQGVPNAPLTLSASIPPPPGSKDRVIRFRPAIVDAEAGQTDVRIVLDPKLTRGKSEADTVPREAKP